MKSIIIYKSKYGTTRQYAQWLSDQLQIELITEKEMTPKSLNEYDCLIIGSPVYIGKLMITEWLKKNIRYLASKKIILFIVCGTNPDDKDKLQTFIDSSVPAEIKNQCDIFFLRGRILYQKLSIWDKILVKMGASIAKTQEEKEIFQGLDLVNEQNITSIVKRFQNVNSTIKP